MTIQEFKRLREEKPFRPFRILTADGRAYDVLHPECLAQSPSRRLILIGLPDDSSVTLDLSPASTKASNLTKTAQNESRRRVRIAEHIRRFHPRRTETDANFSLLFLAVARDNVVCPPSAPRLSREGRARRLFESLASPGRMPILLSILGFRSGEFRKEASFATLLLR